MLFIFDWDGTLSDSTGNITQAMQNAARDLGWPVPATKDVRNIIGLGLPEAVLHLYPNVAESERSRLRDAYRVNFLALNEKQPSGFFPTVAATIELLRDQGHTLAIATGKSRMGLKRILAGLGMNAFFHGTRCADETASKPHPLMLEQLLEEFRTPVTEAVMIGDTEYDMDMARRINMPRIAVSYGAHALARLQPYEPELCLNQFDELLQWQKLK